jgi:hypothetical protein
MQIAKLHRTAGRPLAPGGLRRHHGMVLLAAGTLALVLGTTGIVAALAGRSSPATQAHQRSSRQVAAKPAGTSMVAPVLADGTHPTYIRGVDVQGATITVDVIQVFQDNAATKAAIEDGKTSSEAESLYVYVRNQSNRLRTLPVVRDVRIEFLGECEAPPNRHAALTELAKKTTPFDSMYYYDVTVVDGAIHQITQRQALPAC